jgi:hypothetical protein
LHFSHNTDVGFYKATFPTDPTLRESSGGRRPGRAAADELSALADCFGRIEDQCRRIDIPAEKQQGPEAAIRDAIIAVFEVGSRDSQFPADLFVCARVDRLRKRAIKPAASWAISHANATEETGGPHAPPATDLTDIRSLSTTERTSLSVKVTKACVFPEAVANSTSKPAEPHS